MWCWERSFISSKHSIALQEIIPIAMAIVTFSDQMANEKIVMWCGNQMVCTILNKQSSRCHGIMDYVRLIVLTCLEKNTFCPGRMISFGLMIHFGLSLSCPWLVVRFGLLNPVPTGRVPGEWTLATRMVGLAITALMCVWPIAHAIAYRPSLVYPAGAH